MPNLSPEAVKLLEDVIEVIHIEPKILNMDMFFAVPEHIEDHEDAFIKVTKEDDKPKVEYTCGTTACIAGTICAIKDGKISNLSCGDVAARASDILGLDQNKTWHLFYNDLLETELEPGSPEYIEEATKIIRDFIANDAVEPELYEDFSDEEIESIVRE